MDTPIERKPGITRKHLYVIGGIAFVIAVVLYYLYGCRGRWTCGRTSKRRRCYGEGRRRDFASQ